MFELHIEHTLSSCIRLGKAVEECYGRARLFFRVVLAGIPCVLGFAHGLETTWGLLLFLFGVYLYYQTSFMYERDGKRAWEGTPEQYRKVDYLFGDKHLTVRSGGAECTVDYSKLCLLAADGAYAYLFINSSQAYMASLDSLDTQGYLAFRSFMEEKTGLKWRRVKGRLTFMQTIHKNLTETKLQLPGVGKGSRRFGSRKGKL